MNAIITLASLLVAIVSLAILWKQRRENVNLTVDVSTFHTREQVALAESRAARAELAATRERYAAELAKAQGRYDRLALSINDIVAKMAPAPIVVPGGRTDIGEGEIEHPSSIREADKRVAVGARGAPKAPRL